MLLSGSRIQPIGEEDGISRDLTVHLSIIVFWKNLIVLSSHFVQPISTMASLIGSLGAFDPSLKIFTAFLERLEQFYIANDIGQRAADATEAIRKAADKKKVAVIISVIGSKTYNTLRDLYSPLVPKEKSSEICELLKSHYKPKNLEVAGSFKFHS